MSDHELREAERAFDEDPTPEMRLNAARVFFRFGRQPTRFLKLGDRVTQHHCYPGLGPWDCVVVGYDTDGSKAHTRGFDGSDYTDCGLDLVELVTPVELREDVVDRCPICHEPSHDFDCR